ncbi:hypothetical protein [Sulfitobacter sp.]|uniref:hypothetical protein n=1 Tax=Sulfitobacter sp. TaxID=1903071 RepID=UPI0030032403
MSVLVGVLFWLSLAALGLAVLVLVTPVLLRVHLTNSPLFACRVEIHALGGLEVVLLFRTVLRLG